jgi:lysophospholipase L1-like esterase
MNIICFGDSNTYGYDPRSFFGDPYDEHSRWVDILAEKLNCKVLNAGENGREIPRREEDVYAVNLMLEKQKTVDLLIVMLGSNDLLQGNRVELITKHMEFFLQKIKLDKLKILLISPPYMKLGEWVTCQSLIQASQRLSVEYGDLAQRLDIKYADSEKWEVGLTYDGVHFTEEGHRAFAEGLYNYLKEGE